MNTQDRELQDNELNAVTGGTEGYPGLPLGTHINVTPWSSHFRDVLKNKGVHDCAAGRGLLNTWSSDLLVVLRIRIDQCLMAGAVSIADVRVGESVGSDHFATINDLLISGP